MHLSVKVAKDQFETEFTEFLKTLRPRTEYVNLSREIILDVWKSKKGDAESQIRAIGKRISEFEEKRQKLLEAHVYRKSLPEDVYRREEDRLSQEIAFARIELLDAQMEQIDIDGVLSFYGTCDPRRQTFVG